MGDPASGKKTVVVTGGNAGLGYECAKAIAASDGGWRVILAVRGPEKGERAARAIAEETGNLGVNAMRLDLASLASRRPPRQRFGSSVRGSTGPSVAAPMPSSSFATPS